MLHQIGAGTLGPVFRAYEPERDRLVAIKLFRLDLPPERVHQLVAQFEHLRAAGLDHPVIVAPLAAGIEGVTAYLAQEYVAADSLDVVIREASPVASAEAVGIATRLAEALDYAAERGVVHGALHPRDVLLSPDDLRMVGLGITRALERVGAMAPVRRPYTSPERIGGGAWDHRADVFSLAAVIYEIIWGRRIAGTGAEAASLVTDGVGGSLPALRDVFARALADDMVDRFPTAGEFSAALAGAFDGKPAKVSRMVRRTAVVPAPGPVAEPMLPLDAAEPENLVLREPSPPRLPELEGSPAVHDGAPREPQEEARPVELFHASAAGQSPHALQPPEIRRHGTVAVGSLFSQPPAAERSSLSLVWPLALAGIVGVALGFGAGYAVAIRDRAGAIGNPNVADAADAVNRPGETPVVPSEIAASGAESPKLPTPSTGAPPGSAVSPPSAAAPTPATAPLFAGRVLVRSTPPGARVFVDGHGGGETPATVRDLTRGPHQVRLVHDGYTTVERRIVITAAQPAVTLNVPMAKAPVPAETPAQTEVPLVIESRPPGADVLLDGRQVGTTPLTFPLVQVGAHSVRLVLEGYRPWSATVQVSASEPNRVTASLEK